MNRLMTMGWRIFNRPDEKNACSWYNRCDIDRIHESVEKQISQDDVRSECIKRQKETSGTRNPARDVGIIPMRDASLSTNSLYSQASRL